MTLWKINIKGKIKHNDVNWIIRFQIDPVQAQADYFKYYPKLKPSTDMVAHIETYALKSLGFLKFIWLIYQYMDKDTQKAFLEYTHDHPYIHDIPNSLVDVNMDDTSAIATIVQQQLGDFTGKEDVDIERCLEKGIYLFNKLPEKEQFEIAKTNKNWLVRVILSFHPNKKVKKYLVNKIIKNATIDHDDIINVYKKLGYVDNTTQTVREKFVANVLDGDVCQNRFSPRPLDEIKKFERELRDLVHKDSRIINNIIEGPYSGYILSLLFEKSPEEARPLFKKFMQAFYIKDVFALGNAVLLDPAAKMLREKICEKIFKEIGYMSSESIHSNQIPTYAKFFMSVAVKYPEEWEALCNNIANYKLLGEYDKMRDKKIAYIFHGEEHYKYTRHELWERNQPFDGNFVKLLLVVHMAYGIPLNNALQPLIRCLNMTSLNALMSLKPMRAYEGQWCALTSLYEKDITKSVENAQTMISHLLENAIFEEMDIDF